MITLDAIAKRARLEVLELSRQVPHHLGGCLSCIEIFTVLFHHVMRQGDVEDYFVLSKGHAAITYYQMLASQGKISKGQLDSMGELGSPLLGHPCATRIPGVSFSTGSLGLGLSYAVGLALGLKRRADLRKVFVLVGDGEIQAGICWEALLLAAKAKLTNLTIIVDNNLLQTDDFTDSILSGVPAYRGAAEALEIQVFECDGHDLTQLCNVLKEKSDTVKLIIAHTVKGKGVNFMENQVSWHSGNLSEADYAAALNQLHGLALSQEDACGIIG